MDHLGSVVRSCSVSVSWVSEFDGLTGSSFAVVPGYDPSWEVQICEGTMVRWDGATPEVLNP